MLSHLSGFFSTPLPLLFWWWTAQSSWSLRGLHILQQVLLERKPLWLQPPKLSLPNPKANSRKERGLLLFIWFYSKQNEVCFSEYALSDDNIVSDFKKIHLLFVDECLPAYVYVPSAVKAWRRYWVPWTRVVSDDYESPWGCWEPNPGLLQGARCSYLLSHLPRSCQSLLCLHLLYTGVVSEPK